MRDPESFHIRWRTFAVLGLILNLGLIAALVALAFQNGEGLSSLALTLAIIAFLAQIAIFAFQTAHAGEQLREARDLNRSTLELISDLRSQVTATHDMVVSHNDVLLKRLSSEKSGELPPSLDPLGSASPPTVQPTTIRVPDEDLALLRRLKTWPPAEEIEASRAILQGLPEPSLTFFSLNLATSVIDMFTPGSPGALMASGDEPLISAGLAKEIEPNDGSRKVVTTEKGFEVGRVLTAKWPPPDEVGELRTPLYELRERASTNAMRAIAERLALIE